MKKLFSVLSAVLSGLLFSLCPLYASYDIDSLNVDVFVAKDAVAQVEENYVFDFRSSYHGFYRFLPQKYESGDVKRNIVISSIECSDSYSRDYDDGFLVLKVGSSSVTHTGLTPYKISYHYDIGADVNSGYDEFYYNLVGDGWEVAMDKVSFRVVIPCEKSDLKVWVTSGYRGSYTEVPFAVESVFLPDAGNCVVVSGTVRSVLPGMAVTIRCEFPDGWYEGARQAKDSRAFFTGLGYVLCFVCVLLALFVWYRFGRDPVPVVYARFKAPEGFSPLAVGFAADGIVDDKDITSMLFYWADGGYISIAEPVKNRFEFTKLRELPSSVPPFERELFAALFRSADKVSMKMLEKSNFYEMVTAVKFRVRKWFSGERALTERKSVLFLFLLAVISVVPLLLFDFSISAYEYASEELKAVFVVSLVYVSVNFIVFASVMSKWYVLKHRLAGLVACFIPSVICFVVMTALLLYCSAEYSAVLFVLCLVSSAVTGFLAVITRKRSAYGNRLLEEILGYREFIEKVSADELKLMVKDNPSYYYNVLSYAVVLGLEDTWAKKFASITVPPPVWYSGINRNLNVLYFSNMATRLCMGFRAQSATRTGASRTVGGGGFGLSGFAGGGFGGGGGRAW